jgi:hypothetical protein
MSEDPVLRTGLPYGLNLLAINQKTLACQAVEEGMVLYWRCKGELA